MNIPDLDNRLQRRIAMIAETARRLAELHVPPGPTADRSVELGEP